MTDGRVQIGPASMYTIIKKLANAQLIEPLEGDGKKKSYQITAVGRDLLAADLVRRQAMVDDDVFILEGGNGR